MPPLFQSITTAPPLLRADLETPVFRPLPPPWTAVAGAARPQPPAAVARRPRATSTHTDSAGGRAGQPRCRPTRPLPSPAAAGPRPGRPCLLPCSAVGGRRRRQAVPLSLSLGICMTGGPLWARVPQVSVMNGREWVRIRVHLAYLGLILFLNFRNFVNLLKFISYARKIQKWQMGTFWKP
jgi:hypothetical protein